MSRGKCRRFSAMTLRCMLDVPPPIWAAMEFMNWLTHRLGQRRPCSRGEAGCQNGADAVRSMVTFDTSPLQLFASLRVRPTAVRPRISVHSVRADL